MNAKKIASGPLAVLLYVIGLAAFYYKYVPLVKDFQMVLAPILLIILVVTWRDIRTGTLLFIFLFPLINNLPYFFGIHEPLPVAPTALVLFLFYFLGYLARSKRAQDDAVDDPSLFRPIALFAALVIVSGLITFWRYANFPPLASPRIFELITNSYGVRSGGAIMSIVFNMLNYLTEFAFFWILYRFRRSEAFLWDVLRVLCVSTLLSLGFALFQHFGHPALGNNPVSISAQIINGTFKDALSFGAYLSMIVTLFLGCLIALPGWIFKVLSALVVALSLVVIIYTGSKSGVASLAVSILCFAVLSAIVFFTRRHRGPGPPPKKGRRLAVAALLLAVLLGAFFVAKPVLKPAVENTLIFKRFFFSNYALGWRAEHLWKSALQMMRDYPLTGVGVGGFIIEVANYSAKFRVSGAAPESAENALLQIGAESGAIGALLVFWIIFAVSWKIIKIAVRSRDAPSSKSAYLICGAISGMIAFVLNAQSHTYIGSYEIKYAFWLLAGLIFIAHGGYRDPADGARAAWRRGRIFTKKFKVGVVAVLVIYGSLHLWNSTHSLSLKRQSERYGIKQDFGLDKLEKTPDGREFRWTGRFGGWALKIEKPVLVVPLQAAHPDIQTRPVVVRFYFTKDFFRHDQFLEEIVLSQNDWREWRISVPGEVGKEGILFVKVDRTWNPQRTTGVPDPRDLGVAIGGVRFEDQ